MKINEKDSSNKSKKFCVKVVSKSTQFLAKKKTLITVMKALKMSPGILQRDRRGHSKSLLPIIAKDGVLENMLVGIISSLRCL